MLSLSVQKQFSGFDLSFRAQVPDGFTALFGPSGSGKTTTLNLIAGLLRPDAGEVVLDGRTLFSAEKWIDVPPRLRRIGYVFQESRLFPHLTVEENLRFGLRRTAAAERKFGFEEIVSACGVAALLGRYPADLSGGEQQRVALGRSLLAGPEYLLADEPLAALDLHARHGFLQFLKEIHGRFSLRILYVSHDLGSVLNVADHVLVMEAGRLVSEGQPYQVVERLKSAPLLATEVVSNIFRVTIEEHREPEGISLARAGRLRLVLPRLAEPAGKELVLDIPADEILVATAPPQGISARNILPGKIDSLHHLGTTVLMRVDAGALFTVEVVPQTVESLDLKPGKAVHLIIKASSFRRLE